VSVVDDVGEHVRGIGAVGGVADFVDDEEGGVGVAGQPLGEPPVSKGRGEMIDEFDDGDEVGVEVVLYGAIGNGDGQVSLAASRLALEDQRPAFRDDVGGEGRA